MRIREEWREPGSIRQYGDGARVRGHDFEIRAALLDRSGGAHEALDELIFRIASELVAVPIWDTKHER
jgi:hypothetical protein